MKKKHIYKEMNISDSEIKKGEKIYRALSKNGRLDFLRDIYAEKSKDGYYRDVEAIYGMYPDFRKVIVINFAIYGSEHEQVKIANALSNPYSFSKKIIDFYFLISEWFYSTKNKKIKESLSRSILFYIDKNEIKNLIDTRIGNDLEFAKGTINWLYIQPEWFRQKYIDLELNIWKLIQSNWSKLLKNEFQVREINKALGLSVDKSEIWLHEIQNPWNFNDDKIKELQTKGVDIRLDGYIGEFAMGSPLITGLIINREKISKAIGGPFIIDDNNAYLCCTTFSRNEHGFVLTVIDLKTNKIYEIDSSRSTYTPYRFDNGEFIVIVGDKKIDLKKDIIRINLNELIDKNK